ncbi:hypothetical protein QFC22_003202 [Naganishia vaughanmartiniae]|uniref:Uncharacterized protein n=1 Tax=Naganishia vaughanmartiniae TaxID=1424756 RepID=A0ACC2X7V4_9TREE|nr:hypothetical protein QFC22_003202 [Naganishia vaughanmartiniae]
MASDKLYSYDAQLDANVYFDDGKVRGKSVINDREVALANMTLLSLSRLINNPTRLLAPCLPTCERRSAQTRADYTVRNHNVYKFANKMVAAATGGVWDLVLESKNDVGWNENGYWHRGKLAGDSEDDDDQEDELEADIMAVASRNANGRSSGRNRGRGRGGTRIKKEKAAKPKDDDRSGRARSLHALSSSPLTEAEEDDDEEAVDNNAWFLLDWTIDLWIRCRADSKDPYNDPFLQQLPSSGGPGPRWSIARPMIVIRSAIRFATSAKDIYAEPLQVGIKLLSLLHGYSKLHPPGIDPDTLFTAAVRELNDLDNSEGLHRIERYYEMLQSATGPEYTNRVLAQALARATTTTTTTVKSFAHPGAPAPTLSDILEWLPTTRLIEKRPRGVSLPAHEEKYTCIKAYLLVNVLMNATESELVEWPLERRRDAIERIFAGQDDGNDAKHLRSSMMLLPDEIECTPDEYKALVIAVHENL